MKYQFFFLFSGLTCQNKARLSFNCAALRKNGTATPSKIQHFGAENWKLENLGAEPLSRIPNIKRIFIMQNFHKFFDLSDGSWELTMRTVFRVESHEGERKLRSWSPPSLTKIHCLLFELKSTSRYDPSLMVIKVRSIHSQEHVCFNFDYKSTAKLASSGRFISY